MPNKEDHKITGTATADIKFKDTVDIIICKDGSIMCDVLDFRIQNKNHKHRCVHCGEDDDRKLLKGFDICIEHHYIMMDKYKR